MFKNTYILDEEFPKSSIDGFSKSREEEVKAAYSNVKDEEFLDSIGIVVREMIPQIDDRIHYWENRRTFFLQISLGIIAVALAGLIAIAPELNFTSDKLFSFSNILYISIFFLCVILVFGGIRILALWNEQNNPTYPFNKGTKTWLWQYRHAETNPINTDTQKFDNKILQEEVEKYANNLADYKIKLLSSNFQDLLDQNISQLYLLLINEKFKIKFVTKLRDCLFSVLKIAIYGTAISIILLGVISLVK